MIQTTNYLGNQKWFGQLESKFRFVKGININMAQLQAIERGMGHKKDTPPNLLD